MDNDLLGRIDSDPEVRDKGRSAFIRSAVRLYLKAKERREIEARLAGAYEGQADALLEEIEGLMGEQSWPSDPGRDLAPRPSAPGLARAGDGQSMADVSHLLAIHGAYEGPQLALANGEEVAQIDAGRRLEPFRDAELDLGRGTAHCGRNRRDRRGMEQADQRRTAENQYRALLVD